MDVFILAKKKSWKSCLFFTAHINIQLGQITTFYFTPKTLAQKGVMMKVTKIIQNPIVYLKQRMFNC